jgi:hypothetical protein
LRITVLDRADVTSAEDLGSALLAEGVTEDFKSLPPGKQSFLIRRIDEAARPETAARGSRRPWTPRTGPEKSGSTSPGEP